MHVRILGAKLIKKAKQPKCDPGIGCKMVRMSEIIPAKSDIFVSWNPFPSGPPKIMEIKNMVAPRATKMWLILEPDISDDVVVGYMTTFKFYALLFIRREY